MTMCASARLPVEEWLSEVPLHASLNADIEERFGAVPQQSASAIDGTVLRIETAARQCVAPSACAHPFGSTVNGFGETSSDLDVLIAVDVEELLYYMSYVTWYNKERRYHEAQRKQDNGQPWRPDRPAEWPQLVQVNEKAAMACAVQQLADFLPELGFKIVRALPHARRPLLTVEDNTGEMGECDVSVNNRLPLCNSELLRSYSLLHSRLRPLVLLTKSWAKNHRICGANEGNLSSYAWTIMVIYFLQLVDGVPSLQLLAEEQRSVIDSDYWGYEREFDISFLSAEEYLRKHGAESERSSGLNMAELLYGFFHFFSHEYLWGREVVSIRCPERREADAWFRLYGKCHVEPGIHVEDPIELRDLNIVLRRDRLAQLRAELERAATMLQEGCSLEELLTSPALVAPMNWVPPRRPFRAKPWSRRMHRPLVQS